MREGALGLSMSAAPEPNPYAAPAPDADLAPPSEGWFGDAPLASPWNRLWVYLFDSLLYGVAAIPGGLLAAARLRAIPIVEDGLTSQLVTAYALVLLGVIAVAAYQWYLVSTTGQTLGKRLLRIRIVLRNGDPVGFVHGVLLRSWVMFLLGAFPYVGSCVNLVDILMIFTVGHRCLHDRIAGTIVVST